MVNPLVIPNNPIKIKAEYGDEERLNMDVTLCQTYLNKKFIRNSAPVDWASDGEKGRVIGFTRGIGQPGESDSISALIKKHRVKYINRVNISVINSSNIEDVYKEPMYHQRKVFLV